MAKSHVLVFLCAAASVDLAFATSTTSAGEQPLADTTRDEIVVTASRIEEPRRRAPAAVAELSAERLDAPTGGAMVEVLRFLPGLEVFQSGGPGRVTSLQLRGANTSHTLVLLDGVRLNDATTGQFDFADLRGVELERVEVVRGPQSALWGSEAIGGVVNLITAAATPGRSGRVRAGVGSGSLAHAGGALNFGGDRFGGRLALDAEEGRLLSVADERGGNSERDHHQIGQLSARARLELDPARSFDLVARSLDSSADLDGFDFLAGPVDDLDARQERRLEALALSYSHNGRMGSWVARLGGAQERLRGEDPTTLFNNFAIDSSTVEASLQGDRTWSSGHSTAGLSCEQRRGENLGNFDEQVDLAAVFGQHRVDVAGCVVSLGARHDEHETFGGASTVRVGTSCALGESWVARLSWGTGFRAPSFNELAFPFFGNLELEPERSRGGDVGLVWSSGPTEVSVTAFAQRFSDLIGVGPDFTAVNVARARTEGLETSLRTRLGVVSLDGSYTLLESEDEASGEALPRRPRHRATLWLGWDATARLSARLGVLVVADRVDVAATPLADYQRLDVGLRYRLRDSVDLDFGLLNALDEDYQEVAGYGTPGRLGRVAVTWRWGG